MDLHYLKKGSETDDDTDDPKEPKFILQADPAAQVAPAELPPAQTLQSFIQSMHETGKNVADLTFTAHNDTMVYGYKYLIQKYQSRCYLSGGLIFKDKLKYLKDDRHKFTARNIGKDLLKCINGNTLVVFIPLYISYKEIHAAHQNLLIYRPFKQIIERFEPDYLSGGEALDDQLRVLFQETLKPVLREYTPEYVPPEHACPAHKVGLQEVEELSRFDSKFGHCQMWSLFLMESILMNPELETSDVIEECFRLSESDPDYLRHMMRGYVEAISKAILAESEFNIKSGQYTARNPSLHKKLQIQDALNRAAFQQTKRNSPARKHIPSRKVKRTSPEGQAAKVLNRIRALSPQMTHLLFKHFNLKGLPRTSELLKHVLSVPIHLTQLNPILRDLEPAEASYYARSRKKFDDIPETMRTRLWHLLFKGSFNPDVLFAHYKDNESKLTKDVYKVYKVYKEDEKKIS